MTLAMPELPELEIYRENLATRVAGHVIRAVEVLNIFTVRTADPALTSAVGRTVAAVGRRDKHLYLSMEGGPHLIFHMKLSGRLRWKSRSDRLHAKIGCLKIDFDHGSLHMTEASTRKMASLHVVRALEDCGEMGRGAEPLDLRAAPFRELLARENRQLKGALTDPRLVAGIGNAYSDEILFAAGLSPLKLTHALTDDEWTRLHAATQSTLREWIDRIRTVAAAELPTEQGDWRRQMKVHGKFKSPCPVCGARIERIAYAGSETHYCPTCQNRGRKLSDRRLDRLMR
jgi:formamidopyrimidine-DNA glycosylase